MAREQNWYYKKSILDTVSKVIANQELNLVCDGTKWKKSTNPGNKTIAKVKGTS